MIDSKKAPDRATAAGRQIFSATSETFAPSSYENAASQALTVERVKVVSLSSWPGLSRPSITARAGGDGPDEPGHVDGATTAVVFSHRSAGAAGWLPPRVMRTF